MPPQGGVSVTRPSTLWHQSHGSPRLLRAAVSRYLDECPSATTAALCGTLSPTEKPSCSTCSSHWPSPSQGDNGIFCHLCSSAFSTLWHGWDPPPGPADWPLDLRSRVNVCTSPTAAHGSVLPSLSLAQHVALWIQASQGTHGHRGLLENHLSRV